jgi:putative tryptophan/tyrosine transport system substrate-binding protein
MKRRAFLVLLGSATVVWPPAARAQKPPLPVIGFLSSASAEAWAPQLAGFRDGLKESGFVEGSNVLIEYRWAKGQYDRLPALAADLVDRRVNVIFATGGSAPGQSAKAATTKIPIVFESGGDPVKAGLVASLNRPGGNVTGVSWVASALGAKRLDLLHQLVPKASLIGVLVNPNYPEADFQVRELQHAAGSIGLQIHVATPNTERGIDEAFAVLVKQGVGALLVANDPFFSERRKQIVGLSTLHAIPAIYPLREDVAAGGLISYGANLPAMFREGGIYTGRILKGTNPADLPVMQPTSYSLVINLKTAQTLGLTIPPGILAIADEVIE